MFTTELSARIVRDRHRQNAIHDRVSIVRRAQCLVEVLCCSRYRLHRSPRSSRDDLLDPEFVRRSDRSHRTATFRPRRAASSSRRRTAEVSREGHYLFHLPVERDERGCILRIALLEQRLKKALNRSVWYFISLPAEPLVSISMATESGCAVCRSNKLMFCLTPLSKNSKLSLFQTAHRFTARIFDRGNQADQPHIDFERGFLSKDTPA